MKEIKNSECLVDFGKYIKDAREGKQINQIEIAELLGMTQSYYSRIERGQREVDLVTAMRICRVLSLDMKTFIAKYL